MRPILIVLLAALGAFAGAPLAQAGAVTMTLAYGLPAGSTYDVGAQKFKELVEAGTKGDVKVQLICCARLGSDEAMFRRMQEGTLDGAIMGLNLIGPFVPIVDTLFLPYMFRNDDQMETVMLGPIGAAVDGDIRKKTGIEPLGYTDMLFRNLYNTKRDINNLSDVRGLKYRVPANDVMIATYKAFGAEATPLGWAETFSATQTGIVDGGDLAAIHLYQSKIYEIAKHMAMTQHFVLFSGFFVSDRFLDKLSPADAAVLRAAGPVAGAAARKFGYQTQADAIVKMKAAGVKFTTPDKGPFIAAVKPVWDDFIKQRGASAKKLIDEIAATAPKQ